MDGSCVYGPQDWGNHVPSGPQPVLSSPSTTVRSELQLIKM